MKNKLKNLCNFNCGIYLLFIIKVPHQLNNCNLNVIMVTYLLIRLRNLNTKQLQKYRKLNRFLFVNLISNDLYCIVIY